MTMNLLTLTVLILTVSLVKLDTEEFFRAKNCDPACTFLSQNFTVKSTETFPKSCETVCADLQINESCDVTEEYLKSTFQNMRHLIGNLAVTNTKFKSGSFLAGLESIECYDADISFTFNNKMQDLSLFNLTSITCSGLHVISNLKRLNMPNLKNVKSNNPNKTKVEILITSDFSDFCVTIQEIKMLMEIETADVDHIFGKYCKPELTDKQCQKPTEGCVEIYGNVEIGKNTDLELMKDVEMIYGSLTIKGTDLKNLDFLEKLKYIAQMDQKPAIIIQDNPSLLNISFPALKRIRSETLESVVLKRNNGTISVDNIQCFAMRETLGLTDSSPKIDGVDCEYLSSPIGHMKSGVLSKLIFWMSFIMTFWLWIG